MILYILKILFFTWLIGFVLSILIFAIETKKVDPRLRLYDIITFLLGETSHLKYTCLSWIFVIYYLKNYENDF